jgi:hypothetical protein
MALSFQRRDKPRVSQQLQRVGDTVIALSGLALLGSVMTFVNSTPPMGELGHFTHDIFDPLLFCIALWGLATGIGLLRAWPWARLSMLVFNSLLCICGVLSFVAFLSMPNGNISGRELVLVKVFTMSFVLIPMLIGIGGFLFFLRKDIRAQFLRTRTSPNTPS